MMNDNNDKKTAIDVLLYADAGFDSGIQFRNHANVL